MNVSALIPVKSFADAKQRLSPLLNAEERRILAEAMMRDVLSRVLPAQGLDATFVVTADDRVSEIASSLGSKIIREEKERGETDAVVFALKEMKQMGIETVLVIPADLPLLRSSDIEFLLRHVSPPPFAMLVPSHDRKGTNALLLSPPDVISLRFGYDSFSFHLSEAEAKGARVKVLEHDRICLDIDEPRDLQRFLSATTAGETYGSLVRMGVAEVLDRSEGL